MTQIDEPDFYLDPDVGQDPYPFYEFLRGQCPVRSESHHGTVLVSGYEEVVAIASDVENFSACNSMTGPFCGFPAAAGVEDATELIEQHRGSMPLNEYFPTFDPPAHTDHRSLMMKLITPKRLAENEEFMWRLADRQLDEFLADGQCELVGQFSVPYVNMVICDLLGVPEEDLPKFRAEFDRMTPDAASDGDVPPDALSWMNDVFTEYVEDRRRQPRDDVLTGLATATFPDGSLPEVIHPVRIATFLFAAGGETTARLIASALRIIAEEPALQERLRHDRKLIPGFLEEVLRVESPIKATSKIARFPTTVGSTAIPAGAIVTMLLGAANRDPHQFENPEVFDPERPNARRHLAFSRGVHSCPGAPLARSEARIALERMLDRMADIRISEAAHGPAGNRRYEWTNWYLLRGPMRLHLEFTPAD